MSRQAVEEGHAKWVAAMKANDSEAFGRIVTQDAVLMPPHQPPIQGRAGVITWFADVAKQARTTAVDVPEREIVEAGEIAIERGSFVWKLLPTGSTTEVEDRGNYLAVWQRQADGSWKVIRSIWNSTLPVAAAV
jgi:ketosteroid isomerase-like protein